MFRFSGGFQFNFDVKSGSNSRKNPRRSNASKSPSTSLAQRVLKLFELLRLWLVPFLVKFVWGTFKPPDC